jgi:hypothetical protein
MLPIITLAAAELRVATLMDLPNHQEEPRHEKNAWNERDRNEAQNTRRRRALNVIRLVTGMHFRAGAQRTHRCDPGQHRDPKEQSDQDRGDRDQFHQQRVLASMVLVMKFRRSIEKDR